MQRRQASVPTGDFIRLREGSSPTIRLVSRSAGWPVSKSSRSESGRVIRRLSVLRQLARWRGFRWFAFAIRFR